MATDFFGSDLSCILMHCVTESGQNIYLPQKTTIAFYCEMLDNFRLVITPL